MCAFCDQSFSHPQFYYSSFGFLQLFIELSQLSIYYSDETEYSFIVDTVINA